MNMPDALVPAQLKSPGTCRMPRDFPGRVGEQQPPMRQGEWEGATIPSSRIWLGNIAATATQRCVRQIFGKFGHLTDAAVFPARIGPLGYAFVNFEQVGHAIRAYDMLNNAVVPLLTGNKQLKMRFKPAKVRLSPSHAPLHNGASRAFVKQRTWWLFLLMICTVRCDGPSK